MNQVERLHRSERERIIGGVCGGLAESFGGSPWLYRVAFIAGTLATGGALGFLYPVLWIFLPSQSRLDQRHLEAGPSPDYIGQLPTSSGDRTVEPRQRMEDITGSTRGEGTKPMDRFQDELLRMSDGAVDAYQRWRERQTSKPVQSTSDVIMTESEVVEPSRTTGQLSETPEETGHLTEKTETNRAPESPQ